MTVVSEDSDYYKLEVKPSLIPNAGNGVFATKPIVKDEIIAEYRGKVFTCGLYEEFVDSGKIMRINDMFIDSIGVAAMINDCVKFVPIDTSLSKHISEDDFKLKIWENKAYNCKFDNKNDKVFVVAMQDIQPGDELYVNYGQNYWINVLLDRAFNMRDN